MFWPCALSIDWAEGFIWGTAVSVSFLYFSLKALCLHTGPFGDVIDEYVGFTDSTAISNGQALILKFAEVLQGLVTAALSGPAVRKLIVLPIHKGWDDVLVHEFIQANSSQSWGALINNET